MGTWSKAVGAGLALILAGVAPGMAHGAPMPGAPPGSAAQGLPAAPVQPGDGGAGAGQDEVTIEEGTYRVTLVTGDVVHLTRKKDGTTTVRIDPAQRPDGRTTSFTKQIVTTSPASSPATAQPRAARSSVSPPTCRS